jgi:hypothetical protein
VSNTGNGVPYAEDGARLSRQACLFHDQIVYDYAGTLTDQPDDMRIGPPSSSYRPADRTTSGAAMVPAISQRRPTLTALVGEDSRDLAWSPQSLRVERFVERTGE